MPVRSRGKVTNDGLWRWTHHTLRVIMIVAQRFVNNVMYVAAMISESDSRRSFSDSVETFTSTVNECTNSVSSTPRVWSLESSLVHEKLANLVW